MLARDLEQLSFPFFHISLPEISSHHIATMPATNLTSVQFKISPVWLLSYKRPCTEILPRWVPTSEFWPIITEFTTRERERVFRTTRIAVTSTRSNEILLSLLLKTTVNSFNANIKYFQTITYTLFYIRMLFFRPRLNILIFLPILGLKYSKIIAYDISVLEFIRVSITSVWYLDLYGVALCTCSIAFRCSQRGQDVTSNDTWPFWLLVFRRSEKGIILYG